MDRLGFVLHDNYTFKRVIGSGAYGIVYEAASKGELYAVKQVKKQEKNDMSLGSVSVPLDRIIKDYFDSKRVLKNSEIYREIALHALVHNHENVITIHQVIEDEDHIYMVMDFFPAGDLFHAITDLKWYTGKDYWIQKLMIQLISVINHCHQMGIYHCDLKPENIMISNDGKSVKIADFGLATFQVRNLNYNSGSSFYMSPERLLKFDPTGFNSKLSDIWSLGVILLNLTCGRNPWKRANPYIDNSYRTFLQDGNFLKKIMPISTELNEFLKSLFHLSPTKRYSLFDLYQFIIMTKTYSSQSPQQPPQQRKTLTPRILFNNEECCKKQQQSTAIISKNSLLLPALEIKTAAATKGGENNKKRKEPDNNTIINSGLLTPPSIFDDDDYDTDYSKNNNDPLIPSPPPRQKRRRV